MASRVCNFLNKDDQNILVKRVSLSEIIFNGRPCNLKISSANNCAVCSAVIVSLQERKCARFECVSTITKIASLPSLVTGNFVMKSILMHSHGVA